MSETHNARLQAIHVLRAVIEQGESLSTALPPALRELDFRNAAFAQMLVYGVLRWRWRLEAVLQQLLQKPLKAKDEDVRLCLLIGLYQLNDTRVPDHAAVNASVELVKQLNREWAAGMVNAVLRNFIRHRDELLEQADKDWQARYSHPIWLIKRLRDDWPDQWPAILDANNQQAPLTLRVNRQKISPDEFVQQLELPADADGDGVTLHQATDVTNLPGYDAGWFAVQDAGAQLAAPLLDLQPGQRVLDACAAPGGKTAHALALQPQINLMALDVSESRLVRVAENLRRLGFSPAHTPPLPNGPAPLASLSPHGEREQPRCAIIIKAGDATQRDWWDGRYFDRIMLDAPCSATGVIRRHPDIKSLRQPDDITELANTQRQLLQNLWPMLAPGGLLLYITCSVLKAENEQQVAEFLATTADATEQVIQADWGQARTHGRQILPGENNMDGFYYALLQKAR
ncbi:MAG: 16S rRNA (cytosine(967)-C(5))-methyltransferase [Gammaproteobacteria bacterium]|nr:16S rRNA (cytosine(967)-C(5))-methyltransferase [Gammaproteobacteria bacterium]